MPHSDCAHATPACGCAALPRRGFLRLGGAGLIVAAVARPTRAAGAVDALLLSCMDYRLTDDIVRYMHGRALQDRYDHVVLAGGALGVTGDRYPAWTQTFWDHLGLAIELHGIQRVIVIDHRDCGAYKLLRGTDHANDAAVERKVHAAEFRKLRAALAARHPATPIETLLMSLDGSVEVVT